MIVKCEVIRFVMRSLLQEKTRSLCNYYVGLTSSERTCFLRLLAREYGVDRHAIHQVAVQVANTLVRHHPLLNRLCDAVYTWRGPVGRIAIG